MAIDGDPAGGLEAAAVADIEMLVAKRLREEHLQHFLRTRDELLRLQRPDDSETIRLLRRRQLHTLKEAWDGVLRALRSELPGALDQLFASLEPEFQERPPSVRVSDAAPSAPAAAVEASVDVSGASLAAKSPIRTRSSRPAPSALNATVAGADGKLGVVGVKEKPALSKSDETPKKRPLDNNLGEQVTTPPSKKAKKGPQPPLDKDIHYKIPIKKIMFLRDVQPEECLFKYPGYSGFYILRCNVPKCRKRLGADGPIVFTWHPFGDEAPPAMGHFEGEGHGLGDEAEIFRKYAIRVIDADTERNTEKKKNTISVPDSNPSPEKPGLVFIPPTSPNKKKESANAKDKGKKPERPVGGSGAHPLSSQKNVATEASASASKSSETFKESFYRAGALANECGDDDDDEEELPPINRFYVPKVL